MRFLLCFLVCLSFLSAEVAPWIELVKEPVAKAGVTYQQFAFLKCGNHNVRYHGNGVLVDGTLLYAHEKEYEFQLEILLSQTHHHSFAVDRFKETARYIFLNDSEGDLFSLSAGLSLFQPLKVALRDRAIIHHGEIEGELHTAIGKEWSSEGYRTGRIWGLAACGAANRGWPWLRGLLAGEMTFCQNQTLKAELEAACGFGKKTPCQKHFWGYGNVAYRLVDFRLKYAYQREDWSIISLEFLQRLLARNAPRSLKQVRIEFTYPFNF